MTVMSTGKCYSKIPCVQYLIFLIKRSANNIIDIKKVQMIEYCYSNIHVRHLFKYCAG